VEDYAALAYYSFGGLYFPSILLLSLCEGLYCSGILLLWRIILPEYTIIVSLQRTILLWRTTPLEDYTSLVYYYCLSAEDYTALAYYSCGGLYFPSILLLSLSRYTLLCCGFNRCHTQILYKENRKMLFGAQKNKKKQKIIVSLQRTILLWHSTPVEDYFSLVYFYCLSVEDYTVLAYYSCGGLYLPGILLLSLCGGLYCPGILLLTRLPWQNVNVPGFNYCPAVFRRWG
jgi:hypothetical protein